MVQEKTEKSCVRNAYLSISLTFHVYTFGKEPESKQKLPIPSSTPSPEEAGIIIEVNPFTFNATCVPCLDREAT